MDAPPSGPAGLHLGPLPGTPGHGPPPAGGDPTHQSSRRARGGPPPRTPRSGTGAGGQTLSPVDTRGTREGRLARGHHEGFPVRGCCPDPLTRPPEPKSPFFRSCTEAVGSESPPSPQPALEPMVGARGHAGRRICTLLPADLGQPARTGSVSSAGEPTAWSRGHVPTEHRSPLPTPTGGRPQAWPGSMINWRLWGPDRAQNA